MAATCNRSILELEEELTATGGQGTCFSKSATQELESHVTTPTQFKYYGSAPREHWTEPAKFAEDPQDQLVLEEESFSQVRLLDPVDLSLLEEIAEGGQANVFLAACEKFSTPGVVKRLKGGQIDLSRLRRRMDKVMEIVRKNSSAICRVMAVGEDNMGNGWILMERMGGDLRNLIDHVQYVGYVEDEQMHYVKDPQMPFEYTDTINMMIDIARGMEDLHSCGLIHRDLKASNILVTPLSLNSCLGEVIGLKETLESLYFYVKIGDYESSELIDGTGFWRPPEVLQALKDQNKPVWSPEGDVYSFGMLCYELLTRLLPFQDAQNKRRSICDRVLGVLGGERPKLPAHVTSRMRELLDLCWQTEPQKRPGWKAIVKSLEDEFKSHLPSVQNPHLYRYLEKVEEPSKESSPDSADQKIGSPSTGSPATSAEFCPDIEHQRAESSSTGVLEMQGPRTGHTKYHGLHIISEEMPELNPHSFMRLWYKVVSTYGNEVAQRVITEHKGIRFAPGYIVSMMRNLIEVLKKHALGKLAIIWDEAGAKTVTTSLEEQIAFQEKCAPEKVVVLWKADAKRDITIKALWEELNDFQMKLENMDETIHSRIHEFIIAFDAAVKQDIALECSDAQSPAALEVWEAVIKQVNFNQNLDKPQHTPSCGDVRGALAAWQAQSPEGYQEWKNNRMGGFAQKETKKAWKVAKKALQQVENIMEEQTVFQLKLDFIAWIFPLLAGFSSDWEDLVDKYLVEFQNRHLHQSSQVKETYDRWVVHRKQHILHGEDDMSNERFAEMVGNTKKANNRSLFLEILVGGWNNSRE
jgi:serine/threonine protein kinase